MNDAEILNNRRAWSGDISALVAEVSQVQSELGLHGGEGSPNLRLLRHYQSIGCVGKPKVMEGAKGLYGYRQLVETVAVRVLLSDGWKLSKIGEALARLADDEVERLILARGAGIAPTAAAAPSGGTVDGSPSLGALDLITTFRRSAKTPSAERAAFLSAPTGSQRQAQAPPARQVAEYSPASWLRISVDARALARAEPGAVARALADATAILASLKS